MSRLRRNFLYTVASSLAPILVTLATVPAYLSAIGDQRYGVMAIVWVINGYFSFFEMGMGRAVTQRLGSLRNEKQSERDRLLTTALSMSAVLAALGSLLLGLSAWAYFGQVDFQDESIRQESLRAIPFVMLAFIPLVLSNVMSGVLQAQERFGQLAATRVLTTASMQILPLVGALVVGPNISNLVLGVALARLGTLVVSASLIRAELAGAFREKFDVAKAKGLFSFGGWVSAAGLIGPLLVISDRFLIGAIVGAAAVTYYALPYNLAMRLAVIPSSLATVVYPRLSYLNDESRKDLSDKSVDAISFLLTPSIIFLMVIFGPALTIWLGDEIASKSTWVGQILLLGVWANCLARVPYAKVQAEGRPFLLVKWMLWQLAPYLGLLYLALKQYGLTGAAWIWSVRTIIDSIGLFRIGMRESQYLRQSAGYAALLLSTFLVVTFVSTEVPEYWALSALFLAAACYHSYRRVPSAIKTMPYMRNFF